jgi:hypothetical protein
LVNRKVAVTSTLAVFENAPPLQPRFLDALSPTAALNYLAGRERLSDQARAQGPPRVAIPPAMAARWPVLEINGNIFLGLDNPDQFHINRKASGACGFGGGKSGS